MSNLRTLCERCNLGKRDKIEKGSVPESEESVPAAKEKPAVSSAGTSDILGILKWNRLSYIDNREAGGALWVIGGHELDDMMAEIKKQGHVFAFSEKGGKATKGQSAWWYTTK